MLQQTDSTCCKPSQLATCPAPQAIKLPAGEKSRRNMARAVARLAAERAAAKMQALFMLRVATWQLWTNRRHLAVFDVWIGLFWLYLCFLVVMRWHGFLVVGIGCYGLLGLLVTSCCMLAATWEYHRSLCHNSPQTMLCIYVTMCLCFVLLPGESEVGKGESSREVARGLAVFILQRGHHFQEEDGRGHSNRSASTLPYLAIPCHT